MEKKENKKKSTKANVKNIKKVTKVKKDEVKVPEEEIIIKKITEKKERKFKVNRRDIIIAIIFLIIGAVLSFFIFKRAPKLKNGEQVAISIDKYKVSEQAIYNDIRKANGLNSALRLIDLNIAKTYYNGSLDEEAKNNSQEQAESYIKQYSNYGYDEKQFLAYYGFDTKEDFIAYLEGDYILNHFFEDKVKASISDDEINEYYEKYGIGKKSVYIISESEGTEVLDKIRSSLKKGTSIEKVASKYEKNTDVVINKADLDFTSLSSYSDEVAKYVKNTKDSSYSKVFTDSTLGNVFVFVVSSEETPSLDDAKNDIISSLVDKKKTENADLYYQVFIDERNAKHIKFYDDEFKAQYDDYVKAHSSAQDNK